MSFEVAGAAYDRFMGRYSRPLAPQLADLAGVAAGQRVLDVGSGPGALTAELVARLGDSAVAAVDPSAPFVEALRERLPGVEAAQASAEALPFADGVFDAALAQLVVHFMTDPVAGLREMARVTRPAASSRPASGTTRASAARSRCSGARRASSIPAPATSRGSPARARARLADLLREAGLEDVEATELEAPFTPATFEEWWEPFTLGVGPAGVRRRPRRGRARGAARALPRAAPGRAAAPSRGRPAASSRSARHHPAPGCRRPGVRLHLGRDSRQPPTRSMTMCRWMAWLGQPVLIDELLFKTQHGIVDQSLHSRHGRRADQRRRLRHGLVRHREGPGVYHSVAPAWADANLRELAGHIESPLFLVHVRAAIGSPVQQTNCHPFRHGHWLFVHNGYVADLHVLRRDLMLAIDPALFAEVQGSTDTEVVFYLALTHGLEDDPIGRSSGPSASIEETARAHGATRMVQGTLRRVGRHTLWAVRYATEGPARSLFASADGTRSAACIRRTSVPAPPDDDRLIVSSRSRTCRASGTRSRRPGR